MDLTSTSPTFRHTTKLPNLDALRAVAALSVSIYHLEVYKVWFKLDTSKWLGSVINAGGNSVTLFFVLSGFLITWLLLNERSGTGTIRVDRFYLKRVLRIWPVYFIVLLICLLLLPHQSLLFLPSNALYELDRSTSGEIALALLLSVNVAHLVSTKIIFVYSHLWSVSLEEQFYLIWPWIARLRLAFLPMVWAIVLTFLAVRIYASFQTNSDYWEHVLIGLQLFRIDCMAIGALGGFAFYNRAGWAPAIARLLGTSWVAWCLLLATLYALFNIKSEDDHQLITPFISVLFLATIISMASQRRYIPILGSPIMTYLGKISYGIYMYNPLAILFSINVLHRIGGLAPDMKTEPLIWNALFYLWGICFNIGLAALSYHFIERYFLHFKPKSGFDKGKALNKSVIVS